MSDLISRSALIKQLLEAKDDEIIKAVIGLVQTQPTAYDVEKVVAELKETNKNEVNAGMCPSGFVHCLTAIDIVRKGGME